MSSVASLARFIGPALGGWLLQRDRINPGTTHYGRTPYWVGALLMLVAFALAVIVNPTQAHGDSGSDGVEGLSKGEEAREAVGTD